MALSDAQLNTVKTKLESGKNFSQIKDEMNLSILPRDIRLQVITKFGQQQINDILFSKVRPGMLNDRLERTFERLIDNDAITVDQINSHIATLQAIVVDLEAKRAAL